MGITSLEWCLESPVERLLENLEVILVDQVQLGVLVGLVVRSDPDGGPQVLASSDEDSADPRVGVVSLQADRAESLPCRYRNMAAFSFCNRSSSCIRAGRGIRAAGAIKAARSN
jgi:hypothetical protein